MILSIIVPAHNEESRIRPMLDEYLAYFGGKYRDAAEIIVVVNGSSDRTEEIVERYAAKHPGLRCIVEPERIGKGGALMRGFRESQGDLIGYADADGSTAPKDFDDLVLRIEDDDVIIASRWCRGAKVSPKQTLRRRIASRVFNLLTRGLFGLRLTDTQCGAKVIKRKALFDVLPRLGITQWAFDVDLLFQLRRAGWRLAEIPTTWHDVIGSKVEVMSASVEMFAALIRLRLIYSPFKWVVALYDRVLGPILHPAGFEHDHLLRHSLIVLVGGQLSSVGNIIFQMLMLRILSESEFGVLAAMLGLFWVVSTPLTSMAASVAHYMADFLRDGNEGAARGMVASLTGHFLLAGLVFMVLVVLFAEPTMTFFRMDASDPVIVTGIILALFLFAPVFAGALQGLQSFNWYAAVGLSQSVARVILAVIAVSLFPTGLMALSCHAVSVCISLLLSIWAVGRLLGWRGGGKVSTKPFYAYFMRFLVALISYSVLMNADVILVKHYFSGPEAGLFARAAVVAKIIVFLPQSISVVMFPKVASRGQTTGGHWRTLMKALLFVSLIAGSAALFCTLFPGLTLRVLAGEATPELQPVLRFMAWALCPLSITFVVMNFELAQRRFAIAWPLSICAILYVGGVVVWHETFSQVVWVMIAANAASLLFAGLCLLKAGANMRKGSGGGDLDPNRAVT